MMSNQAALSGGALYIEASTAVRSEDVQYNGNWYAQLLFLAHCKLHMCFGLSYITHANAKSVFHLQHNTAFHHWQ